MAVNVVIKPKGLLKKNLTIKDILGFKNLGFGVMNEHYTLIPNRVGKYTVLYNKNFIGRGFEVSLMEKEIQLFLPLPTTKIEIELFYEFIELCCKKLKIKKFYRDEELVSIEEIPNFIEFDLQVSFNAILEIEEQIQSNEIERFIIFGAFYPISLGKKEVEEINHSLEGFSNLLNRLQQKDVFYANPILYKRNDGSIYGVYYIEEDVGTVLPDEPYYPFHPKENIESWYVMVPGRNSILYEEFMKHVKIIERYDENHQVVCLKEDVICHLSLEHGLDMITKEKRKKYYFGKVLDDGKNHSHKIKRLELKLEEIVGYNHLAIYLRWCLEHNLLSEQLLEHSPELATLLLENKKDLREIIRDEKLLDGKLRLGFFNQKGREFSEKYYVFGTEKIDAYPRCVDVCAEEYFGTKKYHSKEFKDEAYLFVPYTEEYYQKLSKYIENAWEQYLKERR